MKSIRRYLLVITLSVICLANFTAALHGYRDSLRAADQLLDRQLLEKLHVLEQVLASGATPPSGLFDEHSLYQVWRGGERAAASDGAPPTPLVEADNRFHDVSYQGRRWRALGFPLAGSDTVLIMATRLDAYARLTEDILLRAIIPIIWILPVLGLLIWLVIQVGLKPVSRLAEAISRRRANDFHQLSAAAYPQELSPIVNALNKLFFRLEQAFEREKRFSADAAHELRTPLAVFKVNLHNLAKASAASEELSSLTRAADRMEHSIEQLLALHRVLNDNVGEEGWTPCDLYRVAQQVIADIYDSVAVKAQTIELEGEAAWVLADPSPLAIMLRNLIDNASKYTPEQGRIRVSVATVNERAELLVEDSGPGVPAAEYPRVLDRFYRVGGDRNNSKVVGSGLGLSIVAFVVELFQGSIYLSDSAALGGLAVKLSFPALAERPQP